jgi:L-fuculose-phosphate aldolase
MTTVPASVGERPVPTVACAPDIVARDGGPHTHLVRIAKLAFDRRLTDAAGGNFSLRHGDNALVTPRYAGSRYQWDLSVEQICEIDLGGCLLAGSGEISREIAVHLAAYRRFPEIGAVIHAHPYHVQGFIYAGKTIPPTNEYTDKFGEIGYVAAEAVSHTEAYGDAVAAAIEARRGQLARHPLALLLPWHGIVVVGNTLVAAFETLERVDGSARNVIHAALLNRDDA